MKRRKPKKSKKQSVFCRSGIYQSRLLICKVAILVMFVAITAQCFVWATIRRDEMMGKAVNQWEQAKTITAARGEILDCKGVVLASNYNTYSVSIYPKNIESDDYERIATELSNVLDVDYDKVYKMVSNTVYGTDQKDRRNSYLLARKLDKETADKITRLNLGSGVSVEVDVSRKYPFGNLLSQTIGFTNIDNDGQSGLEKSLDKYLSGLDGKTVTDRTVTGATIPFGETEIRDTVDGYDVTLTVDSNIQYFLENAINEALEVNNAKTAQGIIMDAKTGAILAISSKPDFDLNDPPRGTDQMELLNSLSRNRIVADAYEPGSTFKIITLSSALDSNTIDDNYSCTCPGSKEVNGERIKCWRSAGHGTQTLTQCAENSCNCAFMDLGLKMGTDKFYDYIYAFGFGETTGSGLQSESSGIVTHRKSIKMNDLARIGFGQSIAVTPIQMVAAVSAAVNGGNLMQPYIVETITSADGEVIQSNEPTAVRRVVSEETSAKVRTILESVVANGSGKNAQVPGYRIGGKTGTAQKYENGKIAEGKLIASFIGFAPADDPQYVCLILVDEPKVGTIFGSTVAAPFVRQVLSDTLEYAGFEKTEEVQTVKVPNVCGMSVADALVKLRAVGLNADYQATDTIINQVPVAGTEVPDSSSVLLYTEKTAEKVDSETVEVPKLVGLSRYEAYAALKAAGLEMEIENDYNGENVKYQYPYYGTKAKVGSTVKVRFK